MLTEIVRRHRTRSRYDTVSHRQFPAFDPNESHLNESHLIARVIVGDPDAFAQLYDRSVNKIYKYIYYRVRSAPLAEDLAAQVYLKAWAAIRDYRLTQCPFEAWLFRIAHNLVVDYYRTRHETMPLEEFTLVDDHGEDLEEIAQNHLNGEMLQRAIKHLTPEQQQVIVLKFLVGYSTEELAKIMNRNPGAIRALQHRGLDALHHILDQNNAMADRISA